MMPSSAGIFLLRMQRVGWIAEKIHLVSKDKKKEALFLFSSLLKMAKFGELKPNEGCH